MATVPVFQDDEPPCCSGTGSSGDVKQTEEEEGSEDDLDVCWLDDYDDKRPTSVHQPD